MNSDPQSSAAPCDMRPPGSRATTLRLRRHGPSSLRATATSFRSPAGTAGSRRMRWSAPSSESSRARPPEGTPCGPLLRRAFGQLPPLPLDPLDMIRPAHDPSVLTDGARSCTMCCDTCVLSDIRSGLLEQVPQTPRRNQGELRLRGTAMVRIHTGDRRDNGHNTQWQQGTAAWTGMVG